MITLRTGRFACRKTAARPRRSAVFASRSRKSLRDSLRCAMLGPMVPGMTVIPGLNGNTVRTLVQLRDCPRNCRRRAILKRTTGPRRAWEGSGKRRPASQETCHLPLTQTGRGAPEKEQDWMDRDVLTPMLTSPRACPAARRAQCFYREHFFNCSRVQGQQSGGHDQKAWLSAFGDRGLFRADPGAGTETGPPNVARF